jgi:hypothetical protein
MSWSEFIIQVQKHIFTLDGDNMLRFKGRKKKVWERWGGGEGEKL